MHPSSALRATKSGETGTSDIPPFTPTLILDRAAASGKPSIKSLSVVPHATKCVVFQAVTLSVIGTA